MIIVPETSFLRSNDYGEGIVVYGRIQNKNAEYDIYPRRNIKDPVDRVPAFQSGSPDLMSGGVKD